MLVIMIGHQAFSKPNMLDISFKSPNIGFDTGKNWVSWLTCLMFMVVTGCYSYSHGFLIPCLDPFVSHTRAEIMSASWCRSIFSIAYRYVPATYSHGRTPSMPSVLLQDTRNLFAGKKKVFTLATSCNILQHWNNLLPTVKEKQHMKSTIWHP